MLVIRRRAGEAVLIGDGIEVTVIEITGSRVKLGVQAPVAVPILRKEIRLAELQNVAAAEGASPAQAGLVLETWRAAAALPSAAPAVASELSAKRDQAN